ncbi:L,D-transpeptidase family protein [Candidatus Puniceispirillum sp.]|uniref:L,D-transpeptidase family protein n=1 Tax=Candidatus Puniceispirillum sp. TaxID=2026719 RepID=UPI003F6A211A
MRGWCVKQVETGAYQLDAGAMLFDCIIGKAGVIDASAKREGDMATPLCEMPIRAVYYRADRVQIPTLPFPRLPITASCGWCDAPEHPAYNRHVNLSADTPFDASHEVMWRDDTAYDIVVELGFNDAPVVAGRGSAIFIHCIAPGKTYTAGCVALAHDDLLALLAIATPDQTILIT